MDYFHVSKVLAPVLYPSSAAGIALIIGVLLSIRRQTFTLGVKLTGLVAFFFVFAAFGPLGTWLALPLEDLYPGCLDDPKGAAGVIVLGGGVEHLVSAYRHQLTVSSSGRLLMMADYARRHPDWPIVFSGGSGRVIGERISEADIVRQYGRVLGIDPDRLLYERQSRNTFENAQMTKGLLGPEASRQFVLVTSALHTPRAVGIFRASGLQVSPCPVDFSTYPGGAFQMNFRASDGLAETDAATREWIGLIAAWVMGRTPTLLPTG